MRGRMIVVAVVVVGLAGCGTPGQQAGPSAAMLLARGLPAPSTSGCSHGSKSEELKKQPGYHEFTVSVDSRTDGAPVLAESDLSLFDGGNEVPIKLFEQQPASVGIIVDTSGSMDSKLKQTREALTAFVDDLDPRDDAFLTAFNSEAYLLQPMTMNHQLIITRLELLHAFGGTALYDGVNNGLFLLRHSCYGAKALLLVTDGMDNASSASEKEVRDNATRDRVPIYSIGIGNVKNAASVFRPFHVGEGDAVDMKTLTAWADATKADAYQVREAGDGKALTADAKAIAAAINDRYTLGYVSDNATQAGFRLELHNRSDLTLHVEGAPVTVVNNAPPPPAH